MNRIDRLTATLIHLQSKKIVKADEIARRFEISLRTVYRDVKALMEAGVPIGSEAGTGYFIVDGYHLPPVMFNRDEASSILLAGKLVEKLTDQSVRVAFENALMKIKSVLNPVEKESLEILQSSVQVSRMPVPESTQFPNNFLTTIQGALVDKDVLEIEYFSTTEETTKREIEPIGISFYSGHWHVIGWCRLREGYRDFRADRIRRLVCCGSKFDGRNRMSLQEYLNTLMASYKDLKKAIVIFDKSIFQHRRYMYGYVSEDDLGDRVRMTFLVENFSWLSRYLLSFGKAVEIQEPEELTDLLAGLVEELQGHYLGTPQSLLT
jgi:predicted DNA-binding transcriptional regulator YafY